MPPLPILSLILPTVASQSPWSSYRELADAHAGDCTRHQQDNCEYGCHSQYETEPSLLSRPDGHRKGLHRQGLPGSLAALVSFVELDRTRKNQQARYKGESESCSCQSESDH